MKNVVCILIAGLALSACAPQDGKDGSNGVPGMPGYDGRDGEDGHNSVMALINVSSGCINGGVTILAGIDSNDNGVLDIDTDSNIQSAEICNGLDGQDGLNGTDGRDGLDAPATPFTPVGLVNPCGDSPGIYDEVFIRLSNGTMIASFSDDKNGKNTRFSVLVPGTYVTTDGDSCTFTVDSWGNIINESKYY